MWSQATASHEECGQFPMAWQSVFGFPSADAARSVLDGNGLPQHSPRLISSHGWGRLQP
jgi:hypothetical protein